MRRHPGRGGISETRSSRVPRALETFHISQLDPQLGGATERHEACMPGTPSLGANSAADLRGNDSPSGSRDMTGYGHYPWHVYSQGGRPGSSSDVPQTAGPSTSTLPSTDLRRSSIQPLHPPDAPLPLESAPGNTKRKSIVEPTDEDEEASAQMQSRKRSRSICAEPSHREGSFPYPPSSSFRDRGLLRGGASPISPVSRQFPRDNTRIRRASLSADILSARTGHPPPVSFPAASAGQPIGSDNGALVNSTKDPSPAVAGPSHSSPPLSPPAGRNGLEVSSAQASFDDAHMPRSAVQHGNDNDNVDQLQQAPNVNDDHAQTEYRRAPSPPWDRTQPFLTNSRSNTPFLTGPQSPLEDPSTHWTRLDQWRAGVERDSATEKVYAPPLNSMPLEDSRSSRPFVPSVLLPADDDNLAFAAARNKLRRTMTAGQRGRPKKRASKLSGKKTKKDSGASPKGKGKAKQTEKKDDQALASGSGGGHHGQSGIDGPPVYRLLPPPPWLRNEPHTEVESAGETPIGRASKGSGDNCKGDDETKATEENAAGPSTGSGGDRQARRVSGELPESPLSPPPSSSRPLSPAEPSLPTANDRQPTAEPADVLTGWITLKDLAASDARVAERVGLQFRPIEDVLKEHEERRSESSDDPSEYARVRDDKSKKRGGKSTGKGRKKNTGQVEAKETTEDEEECAQPGPSRNRGSRGRGRSTGRGRPSSSSVQPQNDRVPCVFEGCDKTFAENQNMRRHFNSVHERNYPGRFCDDCGEELSRTDAVTRHKLKACSAASSKRKK